MIPFSFEGVDFALTSLFAVLLIDQIKKSKDLIPPIIGVIVTFLAILFVPSDYILLTALAIGVVTLTLIKYPSRKENTSWN